MEDQKFPRGVEFAPFLCSFMNKYSISIEDLALAMSMSIYTITRLSEGKSYPTDACHAEFCIMFTVVSGKSFNDYKKLSQKDKDDLVAKILASGGSVCTVGGMISLISASGVVVGLSAAGVTSGLAAIGALVGGGMVAGIACVALAPIAVGILLYNIFKPKETTPLFFTAYKNEINTKYEVKSCEIVKN